MHPLHPFPLLANYPSVVDPPALEWVVIDNALTAAITVLNNFLAPVGNGGAYVDAVFGPAQHAAAVITYGQMRDQLTAWLNSTVANPKVKMSSWATRFGRDAATSASTKVITLPMFAAAAPPANLITTLIHESAHGANPNIIDDAYANGVGFRTMPGALRLFNAPYFDYTVTAWQAQNLPGAAQVGNPNAVPAAAMGPGLALQPPLGVQLQRAQGIITHARVHAENMLQRLTEMARLGQVDKATMTQAAGLPVPFLARYWQSWVNTDVLAVADIDAASNFVTAVTTLYNASQALNHQIQVGQPADLCQIAGNTLTFQVHSGNVVGIPITNGDLNTDPWIALIITAMLAAYPPVAGSGVTLAALGLVDQQYHAVRDQPGHN